MKTGTLLVICVILICVRTYGQNYNTLLIAYRASGRVMDDPKPLSQISSPLIITGSPVHASKWKFLYVNLFRIGISNTGKKKYAGCPGLLSARPEPQGLHYLINLLTNENKTALKLACQKTSFGATNKACKKVTGVTFSFPIAINQ